MKEHDLGRWDMSPRDEGTDINDMMNIECGITLLSENEVVLVLQQQ